LYDTSEKSKL